MKKTADDRPPTANSLSPSTVCGLRSHGNSVTFAVKAVPRASRSQIVGWHGDALKVRLLAPPVAGKANAALIALLAAVLAISKQQVEIISGETSRHKWVRVHGLSADQIKMRLELK